VLVAYSEDSNLKVMNGRYGPYITNGTDNFKIPKDMVANKLTYQDCVKIMEESTPTSKKRTVRRKKA
jgi:DNA topoisomerase-1